MNKRRIVITALIGAIAVSTLSMTLTLAWYSSSDRLKVSTFDIDMNGNVQLLMSTSKDLETFKETLTTEDLVEKEFLFAPVSTMYRDRWFSQKGDTPLFYDSSSPALDGVVREEEATSGFFRKRLYLLSNTFDYYVSLDVSKCVFDVNEEANYLRAQAIHTQYRQFSIDEIAEKLNSLRDCLRMSILVNTEDYYRYYVIDPYKQENEHIYLGGVLDNDNDGYYDYYTDDDHHVREVVYGDVDDRSKVAYDDPEDPNGVVQPIDTKGQIFGNSFEAASRIDAYRFNQENSTELTIAEEESYSLADADGDNTEILIPCYYNEPTEIVVSIYLEGWDKACINQTMGACFDANISFKFLRRIFK